MRQVGKVGQRRAKGLRRAAPIVCERAMGRWYGWPPGGEGCVGSVCEICGRAGWWPLAHIDERSQGGDESPENLLNACPHCHDHAKYADGGLACGTARAKQIARRGWQ
jgi:hypothetical protein